MTAGVLLFIVVGVPAVAAAIVGGLKPDSRSTRVISTAAGVLTLSVTVAVAAYLLSSRSTSLHQSVVISGWNLTPEEPAPTLTLHLKRDWAFAPSLAAAFALLLLSTCGIGRHWGVHLQHAAVQGSLAAATPDVGLMVVTASTVAAAMSLAVRSGDSGARTAAIAMRWASADVVLWLWTTGFFRTGIAVDRIAFVGLLLRASAFPFQGGLARAMNETRDSSLLLVPFPAVIWGLRWMEPTTIPDVLGWQLLTAVAVLVPSLLAFASRHDDAASAYRLTAIILWPIALQTPTATTIALVGAGIATALGRRESTWKMIAAAVSVAAPTISILAASRVKELTTGDFVGWIAVSLSAILIHSGSQTMESAPAESVSRDWREAVLVLLVLTAFVAPILSTGAEP